MISRSMPSSKLLRSLYSAQLKDVFFILLKAELVHHHNCRIGTAVVAVDDNLMGMLPTLFSSCVREMYVYVLTKAMYSL